MRNLERIVRNAGVDIHALDGFENDEDGNKNQEDSISKSR